jgi:hypothetical protein
LHENARAMTEPRFDPGGFYEFDLAKGVVRTAGGSRVLLLSAEAVVPLVAAAVKHGDLTPIRRLGKGLGEHVRTSLDAPVDGLTPETVLGHAAAVVALFGWGRLGMERWGDALVVVLEDVPEIDEHRLGVAALLGGLFSALAGREVACVPTKESRFLMLAPEVAEDVWGWTRAGADLPTVVGRLASGGGA